MKVVYKQKKEENNLGLKDLRESLNDVHDLINMHLSDTENHFKNSQVKKTWILSMFYFLGRITN